MSEAVLNDDVSRAWDEVLSALRSSLGESVVKSWINSIVVGRFQSGTLNLFVPTRFIRDWIQRHYANDILAACRVCYPDLNNISLSVNAGCNSISAVVKSAENRLSNDSSKMSGVASEKISHVGYVESTKYSEGEKVFSADALYHRGSDGDVLPESSVFHSSSYALDEMSSFLDSAFTLDNFVVGASNEFALSAIKKIVSCGRVSFSPLFLSSSVGLGKTHLLQAAASCIKQTHPDKKVLYISAEKFMYKFIESLRTNDSLAFKELFRSVDILLVDDIQFISGKDATQSEFLCTFDALINSGKQVILTANCSPLNLKGFDARLQSRFASGLEVNITPADYDLRLGILQRKAKRMDFALPQEVAEFLANRFTRSIRELEGALNRLVAHTDLMSVSLSVDVAAKVLKDTLTSCTKNISIDEIQKKVAEFYGIKLADMRSVRKQKEVAVPRQIAMYLAKEMTTRSLPDIAKSFDRDHATVIYAIKKIKTLASSDVSLQKNISALKNQIES